MTKYQQELNERREYVKLKEEVVVGLLGGLILLVWGFTGYLSNSGFLEKVFICLMLIGGIFILCGLIYPPLMCYPRKGLYGFGNIMGRLVFATLLSMVYVVFILPVGLVMSKKRKDYMMMKWNDSFDTSIKSSHILRQQTSEEASGNAGLKKNKFAYNIYRVLAYFVTNRQYIMLPVLCILLVLGLIFFFVSITVIAPFIYTIF